MILRIALPTPLRRLFDYLPPEGWDLELPKPGVRVRVPWGKRETIGILIEQVERSEVPSEKLRAAIAILDTEPVIDSAIFELTRWVANYYHQPWGEVLQFALPIALREGKALEDLVQQEISVQENAPLILNEEQNTIVEEIKKHKNTFNAFLIEGVTGSGKTEVYLQILREILLQKKQALILVPEISLTPQMISRFTSRFGDIACVLHSGLTPKQRFKAWQALHNNQKKIAIGTRSAVFSSLPHLGIIIVDEEHDLSFKQQEGLRYCARDVALVRAHQENIPIVLGSATPSLESLYNCEKNRYTKCVLTSRVDDIALPKIHVVDIRNEKLQGGLSHMLRQAMEHHLKQGKQVMLFLNRRGYAPVLMCHGCGWIATCPRCERPYTWHASIARLRCHHCDSDKAVFSECGKCHDKSLQPLGHGTERIEEKLAALYPHYKIVRIDRDSTRKKGELEALLSSVHNNEAQILLGTQMLAKGHHFSNVTLVGILDVDGGLFASDFRAGERMAQLITQVAGRAGREASNGEVFIQTRHPHSELIEQLIHHNYSAFSKSLLKEREKAVLPPYSYLVLLRAHAMHAEKPMRFLEKCREFFMTQKIAMVNVLGPAPAPMPKRAGKHRAQLMLQSTHRKNLHHALELLLEHIPLWTQSRQVKWSIDVDPQEMY